MMLCSICKKKPAVIFLSLGEKESPIKGLCMSCAQSIDMKSFHDIINPSPKDESLEQIGNQIAGIVSAVDNIQAMSDCDDSQGGGVAFLPFIKNIFSDFQFSKNSESKNDIGTQDKSRKSSRKRYIETYCDNLNRKAKENKLDRVIGRENEIDRVIQILSRRTKNNPCLVGEPGVGKTAIAEGLALKINSGDVPFKLKNKEICLLDLTALVAGTQFRGQFESRIKGLLDEVKSDGNIILFIDEIHNMVGTGDSEGSMSAANILKPALSRGEIQVIGATTFTEYRKYIEKDAALERRFQRIKVKELSIEQTTNLLLGIKSYYEKFHRVNVPDSLVNRIVVLSERYIMDRFLPDKAIDLLDESCACASLGNKLLKEYDDLNNRIENLKIEEDKISLEQNVNYELLSRLRNDISQLSSDLEQIKNDAIGTITEENVAKVIELWTGIPATKIRQDEFDKLKNLEFTLGKKIKGQNEAIRTLCSAVRMNRTGINPKVAPPSFIFVGSTGVGKTALVKALAEEMFDTSDSLIRLDMSEYMEGHSVSKIIGSPPGYVGYEEAGQITEKVRQRPYSIVLFDEIEKAHPDIMNILLQILDDGKINDSHGRTVSFENTIIIMTSNAGSDKRMNSLGFDKNEKELTEEKARKALSEFLRPELLARIGEIVVFNNLKLEDLRQIAKLKLDSFVFHLNSKGIDFSYTEGALDTIVGKITDLDKNGARGLENLIFKQIGGKLTSMIIERGNFNIGKIKLDDNLEIFLDD